MTSRGRRRPPSDSVLRIRFARYSEWIAEDVAVVMSEWLSLRSNVGRFILRYMRRRVLNYMRDNPEVNQSDAVDNVTTEVLIELDNNEEDDVRLRKLVSP
jgi:hypothetical protein